MDSGGEGGARGGMSGRNQGPRAQTAQEAPQTPCIPSPRPRGGPHSSPPVTLRLEEQTSNWWGPEHTRAGRAARGRRNGGAGGQAGGGAQRDDHPGPPPHVPHGAPPPSLPPRPARGGPRPAPSCRPRACRPSPRLRGGAREAPGARAPASGSRPRAPGPGGAVWPPSSREAGARRGAGEGARQARGRPPPGACLLLATSPGWPARPGHRAPAGWAGAARPAHARGGRVCVGALAPFAPPPPPPLGQAAGRGPGSPASRGVDLQRASATCRGPDACDPAGTHPCRFGRPTPPRTPTRCRTSKPSRR